MPQLDSANGMDPGEELLPMQISDGFHFQQSKPAALDQALVKRCALMQRAMRWFMMFGAQGCLRDAESKAVEHCESKKGAHSFRACKLISCTVAKLGQLSPPLLGL